jgi:hypothetical protein
LVIVAAKWFFVENAALSGRSGVRGKESNTGTKALQIHDFIS